MSLRLSDPPMSRRTRTFLRRWEKGSFRKFLEERPLPPGGGVALLDPKGNVLARLRGEDPVENLLRLGKMEFGHPPIAVLAGDVDSLPAEFVAWVRVLMETIGACKEEVDRLSDHALERHRELNLLYGFTERSMSITTMDELLATVLDTAIRAVQASGASLHIETSSSPEGTMKLSSGTVPSVSQKLLRRVIDEGIPMAGMLPESLRPAQGDRWSGALVCLPLRTAGRTIGTLVVAAGEGRMLMVSDQRMLTALATLAATRIEQTRLQAEAARKRELAAVGHMASAIVHDFKNPLTAIRGFAEMIAMGAASEDEYGELAQQVVNNADKLWSMVDELLHFVRGDAKSLQLREVPAQEFAERLENALAPSIPRCIELKIDLKDIDSLFIDPDKFERVIVNLVRNAVEAIVGRGHVHIVGSECDEQNVCIEVIDDGPGIAAEAQRHIWEPFYTMGKANGTGLGLAIVRKIVQDHGGTIELDSKLGQGSRFVIKLPREPEVRSRP